LGTRIFYATDIHGSEVCYLKFLNCAKFYDADVLIMGGDITGKMLVPLVEQDDGTFKGTLLARQRVVAVGPELDALEKDIKYNGFYPYRTNPAELARLSEDSEYLESVFSRVMAEAFDRWLKLADTKLDGVNIKCFLTPGNDDQLCIDVAFRGKKVMVNPEGTVARLDDDHEMISTGYCNMTPWLCPRDIPEEELEAKIVAMAEKVSSMDRCVFNFHCPPYDSTIDSAPLLDAQLRPVVGPDGQPKMVPVGSKAVRRSIEKHQPLLALNGHIHESRGAFKIGRTICLNPGSRYGEGVLQGLIVELDRGKVKAHQFTSG